ncbi:Uma2 family endonuclease [Chamaesiphon sp.]|uniref:Uma2 family endonuclease n=1 Tax=Chamaesiphon sp. TaxID=2814140 RepID=UPI0035930226
MTISQFQVLRPLNLSSLKLTDEQFYQLCITNPEQPLELTSEGVLIVMPPVGGESGNREADLLIDLGIWNRQTQRGKVFSSSTVFKLPLGSQRSPDAAWVELSRWNALSAEGRSKFPPLAPDFVIELRSRTDKLSDLQEKMLEYRDNGVQLGLLINPQDRIVEIYRIDRAVEVIESGNSIDCDDVLPGFTLDLIRIW